jgi:hypothetical protein
MWADCENVRVFSQYKRQTTSCGTDVLHFAAQGAKETCGATPIFYYGPTQEAPFATVHWLVS